MIYLLEMNSLIQAMFGDLNTTCVPEDKSFHFCEEKKVDLVKLKILIK